MKSKKRPTYTGKYWKCRTCKHAKQVHMILVDVYETCPSKIVTRKGDMFSSTEDCEKCNFYEIKEQQ
jgi:hypothetical protein